MQKVTERQEAAFAGLASRRSDLTRYAHSIADLHATNVATDADYQRRFNALYGVRRNAQWRDVYFTLLEARKLQSDVRFLSVLTAIRDATGRVEASFASKLVATIDPTRAIYDSIVRRNLGLPQRSIGSTSRIDALCRDYDVIQMALEQSIAIIGVLTQRIGLPWQVGLAQQPKVICPLLRLLHDPWMTMAELLLAPDPNGDEISIAHH